MTTCEVVHVAVTSKQDGDADIVALFSVPAYTVAPNELRSRIDELRDLYFRGSIAQRESVSLGDFALYLLAVAAADPREQ